jgi:hypothetical protein
MGNKCFSPVKKQKDDSTNMPSKKESTFPDLTKNKQNMPSIKKPSDISELS